jgi:hypothetical protein
MDLSDGKNYQDLNPTYLWTVQNADRFEFPHDIEPFEESSCHICPYRILPTMDICVLSASKGLNLDIMNFK